MKFEHPLFFVAGITVPALLLPAIAAFAQQPTPLIEVPCPNDEPCVVLVLTKTELNVLTADAGILATAAQARSLDLGQYVAYFRQKIALAPAGKNAAKPDEKKPEETPKKP